MPSERGAGTWPLPGDIQRGIEEVRAGHWSGLHLLTTESDQLTEIPPAVRQLTGLRFLSLDGTAIDTIPSWLAVLPNLEVINISRSPVAVIPSFLPDVRWGISAEQALSFGHLLDAGKIFSISIQSDTPRPAVQYVFDLSRNGKLALSELYLEGPLGLFSYISREHQEENWPCLDIIDSRLDELLEINPALRSIHIQGYPFRRIPEPIRRLRALDTIRLMGTRLSAIPDWLFEVPRLKNIDLAINNLHELTGAITKARNLEYLNLSYNTFTSIPAGVWELTNLQQLHLADCPIEKIPADILRLKRLSTLDIGSTSGVPKELQVPPPEIAAQGLDAIRRYWLQERDAGIDYLAEAKLLIVGEPGAGKTSLAKKILDPGYELDRAEDSTAGIDVLAWQFPTGLRVRNRDGEHVLPLDFRVNIWDFGGQEIYHSTHQFFLTKRSVYVLVTDERKEDADFEYWLEIVSLLSDGSPLLIVRNRKQGRLHRADLGALRQRYPNLCGTLELDLADNSGLDEAVNRIRRELEQLPHIGTPLPKTWRDVRLALEADPRDYISADEFFGICQANGFTDRGDMRQLGGYLHDLGICLFFQDDALLSKTVILKPEWGTAAVYRVLDDPEINQALGSFGQSSLRRIWSDATYEPMRDELLQLMVKFQLCFQVPGSDTYIAPQLLSPSQPTYHWDDSDNLILRYEYDVMPKGIGRRLIVALHYQLAPGDLLWRSGAVFEYEGSTAEVVEVYRRRLLTIRIRGGDPRVLLGVIDKELNIIHRSYPGIRFKRFMPCDCEICSASDDPSMFEVDELKDFARTGHEIQCRRSRQMRDPAGLLRLLSSEALAHRTEIPTTERPGPAPQAELAQPEIFVSYAWGGDSEQLADEIQSRMAERRVLITRDKNEIRYRDSIQQFMQRIGAGKYVVVILSQAYLESKYCMYELIQIASNPDFADRVYPVVLPDAGIFDTLTRLRYLKYWEDKKAELNAAMKVIGQEHLKGIREDLDLYDDIRRMIAELMDVLGDMNTLTPDMHRGTDFEQLYQQLAAALQV